MKRRDLYDHTVCNRHHCVCTEARSFCLQSCLGITKGVLFVIGIPVLLVVLFVAGLVFLAMPLLILALLAAFLWPVLKGI